MPRAALTRRLTFAAVSITRARHASTVSTALTAAGITPVCPTMSPFA